MLFGIIDVDGSLDFQQCIHEMFTSKLKKNGDRIGNNFIEISLRN